MGNREILNRQEAEPAPPPKPARTRTLWTVYLLRDNGEKLSHDAILRTAKTGLLEFWRSEQTDDTLNARLSDPSCFTTLENLYKVRLVRGHREGGLLLYGEVLSTRQGVVSALPQAWWCLVTALEPQPG